VVQGEEDDITERIIGVLGDNGVVYEVFFRGNQGFL
jgi:hypothetical protein